MLNKILYPPSESKSLFTSFEKLLGDLPLGNGTCQVETFQNGSFRFVSGSCRLVWNVSKGDTKRLTRVNWWHETIDTCQTLTRHEKFVSTRVSNVSNVM